MSPEHSTAVKNGKSTGDGHQAELEAIYNSAPVGICALDTELRYLRINERLAEINGLPASEHIGRTVREIVPDLADQLEAVAKKVLETSLPVMNVEFTGTTPGQPDVCRSLNTNWLPIKDSSGQVVGINVAVEDVTERKQVEEALRESEERFRALVTSSSEVLYRMSPDWREMRQLHSRGFLAATEKPNRTWLQEYILPEDQPQVTAVINEAIRAKNVFELEHRVRKADGTVGWTFSRAVPLIDAKGEIVEWFGAASDITERKQAEEALQMSHDELEALVQERTAELKEETEKKTKFIEALRESGKKMVRGYMQRKYLAGNLVQLLEKDRRETAMTLHDQVGSLLTGAKIGIELIELKLADSPHVSEISAIKQSIGEVIGMVREISSHLRPISLDRFGLMESVKSLIEEARKQLGIEIHLHTGTLPERLTPEKDLALYRVIQESLNNIKKHSHATKVFITISSRNDIINLSIEDDGKGFVYDDLDSDGYRKENQGISIMRERVVQFGGSLRVESQPGRGTQVVAELPI